MSRSAHTRSWIFITLVAFIFGGCAPTRQIRSVEPSGFLGDYSALKRGAADEAQLVFSEPAADFSAYDSVLIHSVSIWQSPGSAQLSEEDGKILSAHLYQALHDELSKDYRIVNRPGPRVLHLRAALTEAKSALIVPNLVTTIMPPARVLTTAAGLATDTQALVGRARVEAELRDSTTGRRLLAAVDARAGGKTLRGGFGKWSDVRNSFDFWAKRLRERLQELRSR